MTADLYLILFLKLANWLDVVFVDLLTDEPRLSPVVFVSFFVCLFLCLFLTVQTKMRRARKNEWPVALRRYAMVCVVLLLDEVGCVATLRRPDRPACVHCPSTAVMI